MTIKNLEEKLDLLKKTNLTEEEKLNLIDKVTIFAHKWFDDFKKTNWQKSWA